MPSQRHRSRRLPIPSSRPVRLALGSILVAGGVLGFLPVLGFWMIPLGLTILSADLPVARRVRRRMDVAVVRRWRALARRRPGQATREGTPG